MTVLSLAKITEALAEVPGWQMLNGELVREFSFTDFREAMSFVNAVAPLAEEAGHHPDIDIRYNKVRLALISHDAGGITELDFSLARHVSRML